LLSGRFGTAKRLDSIAVEELSKAYKVGFGVWHCQTYGKKRFNEYNKGG